MIKIDEKKILIENEYTLEVGVNYHRPQLLLKNGYGIKLVFIISSLVELNNFLDKPETQFKSLYIYAPYPDVFIGVNNLLGTGIMLESKDLSYIIAWLLDDVIIKSEFEGYPV